MKQEEAQTIGALLAAAAAANPQGPAVIEAEGRTTTYEEFSRQTGLIAAGLLRLGVEKGEHLALWAENGKAWLLCQFATARAGAVLSTVEPEVDADRLGLQLSDSDARTLIYDPGAAKGKAGKLLAGMCPAEGGDKPSRTDRRRLPGMKNLVTLGESEPPGAIGLDRLMELGREADPGELARREASISPEDIATLLYTSGTTGQPKGVLSNHGGLVAVSRASAANMGVGPNDRFCLTVPLHHMFGCVCVVLAAVAAGAGLVLPFPALDPAAALMAASRHRATAIFGSPTFFLGMMAAKGYGKLDISSLRTGIMGGANCPMEVMRRVVDDMGIRHILVGYGQTEASSWATQTRPDDPLDLRVSTVGRALPGVRTMIADPVSGAALPPGKIGEFRARGFNMAGYYKNPSATAAAVDPAGWLLTGDLATSDEAGNIRILGRLKEVINKNGRAVYPVVIEEACYAHPGVGVAAAFGVKDEKAGEEVALWVKPAEGQDLATGELARFLAQRLPDDHLPRYLELVESFPLTAVGKVQRYKMRQMFQAAREGKMPGGAASS